MRYLALTLLLVACGGDAKHLPVDTLQDPSTCMTCHPDHYTDWASSMHAYASDDPVFLAMNKRGQRETNNTLGTFCVQCHAPMAVALGLTDGITFDPTTLPPTARGITCYFCHNVASVTDTHNNGLQIALDDTMRGGTQNPASNSAHNAKYDLLMDGARNDSSMCGSCHDVVTPKGVALERTYTEYQSTFFSDPTDLPRHESCGACHMQSNPDIQVIADDPDANVTRRTDGFHLHTFAGIDQALTTFPGMDLQAQRIKDILEPAINIVSPKPTAGFAPGGICLNPDNTLTVRMDTFSIAHSWPSGAAQDRRAWLEVQAFDAANTLLFASGITADLADPVEDAATTNGVFWDDTFTDAAKTMPAHFFWDVVAETPHTLRPPITFVPTDPGFDHSTTKTITVDPAVVPTIDHIEAKLRIRPLSYALLDDLIGSGDLDPAVKGNLATLEVVSKEWTRATMGTGNAKFTGCNPF
jgi:Cytochrome c554 and c-prime